MDVIKNISSCISYFELYFNSFISKYVYHIEESLEGRHFSEFGKLRICCLHIKLKSSSYN